MSVIVLPREMCPVSAATSAFLCGTRTFAGPPLRVTVARTGASSMGKNQSLGGEFRVMAPENIRRGETNSGGGCCIILFFGTSWMLGEEIGQADGGHGFGERKGLSLRNDVVALGGLQGLHAFHKTWSQFGR